MAKCRVTGTKIKVNVMKLQKEDIEQLVGGVVDAYMSYLVCKVTWRWLTR